MDVRRTSRVATGQDRLERDRSLRVCHLHAAEPREVAEVTAEHGRVVLRVLAGLVALPDVDGSARPGVSVAASITVTVSVIGTPGCSFAPPMSARMSERTEPGSASTLAVVPSPLSLLPSDGNGPPVSDGVTSTSTDAAASVDAGAAEVALQPTTQERRSMQERRWRRARRSTQVSRRRSSPYRRCRRRCTRRAPRRPRRRRTGRALGDDRGAASTSRVVRRSCRWTDGADGDRAASGSVWSDPVNRSRVHGCEFGESRPAAAVRRSARPHPAARLGRAGSGRLVSTAPTITTTMPTHGDRLQLVVADGHPEQRARRSG